MSSSSSLMSHSSCRWYMLYTQVRFKIISFDRFSRKNPEEICIAIMQRKNTYPSTLCSRVSDEFRTNFHWKKMTTLVLYFLFLGHSRAKGEQHINYLIFSLARLYSKRICYTAINCNFPAMGLSSRTTNTNQQKSKMSICFHSVCASFTLASFDWFCFRN
jgi:hypothetical protein